MVKQSSKVPRPRRVGRVTQYEIDGEVVLYDPKRDSVHTLNPTAAVIWQLCDGSRTLDELVAEIASLFGAELALVQADLTQLLKQFGESHLLRHAVPNDA